MGVFYETLKLGKFEKLQIVLCVLFRNWRNLATVMNSITKGLDCMQRSSGSKIWRSCASSSEIASKVCGCGEKLLLLKASTVKNKGRLFWRCRNWAVGIGLFFELHLVFFVIVSFFVQSNSHCNYFEWVNESESMFEGKDSELESSEGKTAEEDKVCCLEKDKVIMDLIKKNEKLKRKLQQEKQIGKFLQVLFVLSWVATVVLVIMVLLKVNCN